MIEISYSPALVILSVVVAAIGAYVAVEIAQHVRAVDGRRRLLWICGGALAMGLGIWSMHFVAMLALHLPLLVWYDVLLVLLSVVAAVVGCAIAFIIFNRATVKRPLLALASIFMGLAIAAMHYTGMAGMRMNGGVVYDPVLVGASIAVAIVVSFAALALTRNLIETGARRGASLKKAGASLLMGSAVAAMHYTGMAAAHFTPALRGWRLTDHLVLGTYDLGLVVVATSVTLLGIALAATHFERWTVQPRADSRIFSIFRLRSCGSGGPMVPLVTATGTGTSTPAFRKDRLWATAGSAQYILRIASTSTTSGRPP